MWESQKQTFNININSTMQMHEYVVMLDAAKLPGPSHVVGSTLKWTVAWWLLKKSNVLLILKHDPFDILEPRKLMQHLHSTVWFLGFIVYVISGFVFKMFSHWAMHIFHIWDSVVYIMSWSVTWINDWQWLHFSELFYLATTCVLSIWGSEYRRWRWVWATPCSLACL